MIVFQGERIVRYKKQGAGMTQPISVIAKSLVRERARTGLSLAEVARRAGIAKSTLSQLESGNGNPSLETLWSLCVALDIPFARLLEPQVNKTQVIRRGDFAGRLSARRASGHLFAAHPARRRPHFASASARLGGTYYRHPGAGAGRADVGAGRARRGRLYLLPGGSGACFSGAGAGYAGPADR